MEDAKAAILCWLLSDNTKFGALFLGNGTSCGGKTFFRVADVDEERGISLTRGEEILDSRGWSLTSLLVAFTGVVDLCCSIPS